MLDLKDPKNHGKPLWAVYGYDFTPSLMCCKLLAYTADHHLLPVGANGATVVIWGYSVYRGKPGFRTLGQDVEKWCIARSDEPRPRFFESQDLALEEMRKLTTPSP